VLERDIFPYLGCRPIAEISAPEVLAVCRRIENRNAIETARRAKENISQIMRYAIATGRADRDPCPDLRGALKPVQTKNMPALTEPEDVAELMQAIDAYEGTPVVCAALRLAPLVFDRIEEMNSDLQLIVVDHAYFEEEQDFLDSIVEDWHKEGNLIPREWYETNSITIEEEKGNFNGLRD